MRLVLVRGSTKSLISGIPCKRVCGGFKPMPYIDNHLIEDENMNTPETGEIPETGEKEGWNFLNFNK